MHAGKTASAAPSAEEIVARRLARFSVKQRALLHKLADHYGRKVPSDMERFFDALDAGNWEETQRLFKSLRDGDYSSAPRDETLRQFWRPIQEAYGAAEQTRLWPAQPLLDYGNGILTALQPNMVYVGGTDAGLFIPNMLNATSDGEQHIVLTQNALADSSYLDYLRVVNDGLLNIPTQADQEAAFNQYTADAKARLEDDQQFPNEPPQMQPGENVTEVDGKVTVSGQVAVMAINNLLMQDLLQQNPGASFGLQQSFPLPSTYPGAAPLGPIFALNAAADGAPAITSDTADQVVNYWMEQAQNLHGNLDAEMSGETLLAFAHDAASQGILLASSHFPDQAEQAYQTALDISPNCTDAVQGLAQLLAQQGRIGDANAALDTYLQINPGQMEAINTIRKFYLGGR